MKESVWLDDLNLEIVTCKKCPRLVQWREEVASVKRRSYENESYWGRPVPLFGDPHAQHLIVGLAPAAHGANRTGRMFTGDRSGDWLYRALYKAGVANQVHSSSANDGLQLKNVLIAATALCAPPANKPLADEIHNCSFFLGRVLDRQWLSVLCLGSISWERVHRHFQVRVPKFGHQQLSVLPNGLRIISSYHPSQQNTFTGRLTEAMLDRAIEAWLRQVK